MGLTDEESAQMVLLQAKAAEPDPAVVSDAAVVASAEASVEVAQIEADAAVELARIDAESRAASDAQFAETMAISSDVSDEQRLSDAEDTAALALAISVETAMAVDAGGGEPPAVVDPTDTPADVDDASGDGSGTPAAEQAEGDEPPGEKHEQPKPNESKDKGHWYGRTVGGK